MKEGPVITPRIPAILRPNLRRIALLGFHDTEGTDVSWCTKSAALAMSIAWYRKHKVAPEPEFNPIVMFWICDI